MKAEELFVGALVRVNRDGLCIKKDTIVEVRGGDADNRFAKKGLVGVAYCYPLDENQFAGGIWCEYLDPIPLTPEILEKNGWEERKEYEPFIYYLLEGKDYSISLSKEWDSTTKTIYWSLSIGNYIADARFSVDYIHQLQHALRLCQIEKEIEL